MTRLRTRFLTAAVTVALVSCPLFVHADALTLRYRVTITERAALLPIGTTPVDRRIGLSRGPSEAYDARFDLTLTFDVQMGQSSGTGFGTADLGLFTTYGIPRLSVIPLPRATPLAAAGDAGAERDVDGQVFEQQAFDSRTGASRGSADGDDRDLRSLARDADSGTTRLA